MSARPLPLDQRHTLFVHGRMCLLGQQRGGMVRKGRCSCDMSSLDITPPAGRVGELDGCSLSATGSA